MKLFKVDTIYETINSIEEYMDLIIANSKEEAEEKVTENCTDNILSCVAYEILEVEGYKIILEKVGEDL